MKGVSISNPCEIICAFKNSHESNLYLTQLVDFLLAVERENGILRLTAELNDLSCWKFRRAMHGETAWHYQKRRG